MERSPISASSDETKTRLSDASRNGPGAKLSAVSVVPILKFDFNLSRRNMAHYGCIFSGDNVLHRVIDFNEFYEALGYSEQTRKAGLTHDVFLWERYRRDGAVKSAQCLQASIAAYLHKHSATFREKYGRAYDELTGKCVADYIDNDDEHCVDCPKHPRFKY